MRQRVESVCKKAAIIMVIGILYAIWIIKTKVGIPCPIRLITGFRCPGCGISHMCIALLHGDIRTAFYSNRVVFLIMPIVAVVIARQLYRYIRYGRERLNVYENVVICILVVIVLLWGIVRNIPMFQYLN